MNPNSSKKVQIIDDAIYEGLQKMYLRMKTNQQMNQNAQEILGKQHSEKVELDKWTETLSQKDVQLYFALSEKEFKNLTYKKRLMRMKRGQNKIYHKARKGLLLFNMNKASLKKEKLYLLLNQRRGDFNSGDLQFLRFKAFDQVLQENTNIIKQLSRLFGDQLPTEIQEKFYTYVLKNQDLFCQTMPKEKVQKIDFIDDPKGKEFASIDFTTAKCLALSENKQIRIHISQKQHMNIQNEEIILTDDQFAFDYTCNDFFNRAVMNYQRIGEEQRGEDQSFDFLITHRAQSLKYLKIKELWLCLGFHQNNIKNLQHQKSYQQFAKEVFQFNSDFIPILVYLFDENTQMQQEDNEIFQFLDRKNVKIKSIWINKSKINKFDVTTLLEKKIIDIIDEKIQGQQFFKQILYDLFCNFQSLKQEINSDFTKIQIQSLFYQYFDSKCQQGFNFEKSYFVEIFETYLDPLRFQQTKSEEIIETVIREINFNQLMIKYAKDAKINIIGLEILLEENQQQLNPIQDKCYQLVVYIQQKKTCSTRFKRCQTENKIDWNEIFFVQGREDDEITLQIVEYSD
ncbi:hypothetical protein ABPG72_013652 [Tetrahymena utriculariae]